jgi:hypothetical protein
MNIKDNKIWCHNCYKWISKFTDILIIEKDVYCLFCANQQIMTHLGFDFEAFPCQYYYLYHQQEYCRTIQDITKCKGDIECCENKIGKLCYESDKQEEND